MIGAVAACAHTAEGHVFLAEVPQAVVDRDAAGDRPRQHLVAVAAVLAEPVQRQRPVVAVDVADGVVEAAVSHHRQQRPEDLLLHDLHVWRDAEHDGRHHLAAAGHRPFHAVEGDDARAPGACILDQLLQPRVVPSIDDGGVVGIADIARVHLRRRPQQG
ncbi:hypothetical protein D3C72_1771040 [compost metagenome]